MMIDKHTLALVSIVDSSLDVLGALYLAYDLLGAVGYVVAGYISALTTHQRSNALNVGVKAGLVIGAVTAIVGACTPFIEWMADHMPEKLMGVFGVGLILIGFALQSVQYWLALLDVSIR